MNLTSRAKTTPIPTARLMAPVVAMLSAVTLMVACQPPPEPTACLGLRPTIVGTSGDDKLDGTSGADVISGLGGKDIINGLGDRDVLCGGSGVDQVYGGEGFDSIAGGPGADVLVGDTGDDTVDYRDHAGSVNLSLKTGEGPEGDYLSGFESVVGSRFDDHIVGDDQVNNLFGLAGGDILVGQGGADKLIDNGTHTKAQINLFYGGSGNDFIQGTSEAADLAVYDDRPGPVFVNLGTGSASGDGNDVLDSLDGVIGSRGGDTLYGSTRSDRLEGRDGDDLIIPFAGDDTVAGGEGKDRISFFAAGAVNVNLVAGRATGEGTDTLATVEDIGGGNGADTLSGDAGPNTIDGADGIDTCNGGGGNDSLVRCP